MEWVWVMVALSTLWLVRAMDASRNRTSAAKLASVDHLSGDAFEGLVQHLLACQGYTVARTGGNHDLGVDLVAQRRGQSLAVQVKRSQRPVTRHAVSDVVAGALHYGCRRTMVVANQPFTRDARRLAASTGCELVDRAGLVEWLARAGAI